MDFKEQMAQRRYEKSYKDCCWQQKKVIDETLACGDQTTIDKEFNIRK